MYFVVLLLGMIVAFAGALLILYAVPVVDVAAAALFTSGMFAIVGALILFALAALSRGIERIAERLDVQPLSAPAVPPVVTVAREEAAPRAARVEPAPAAAGPAPPPPPVGGAPPAKRPSVLSSWLNRASPAAAKQPPQAADQPAAARPEPAPSATTPEEPRAPAPPVAPPPVEPTVASPPIAEAPPTPPQAAPPPAPPPLPPVTAPAPAAPIIPRAVAPASRPVPPPAPATSPATTVYKSGVIDGMAYTLFMDGAIEAELPQGRVRFASVDELQKYLTNRR